MEIRKNIFISIIIHATVIASVFIVGSRGRDTACRVPEDYMIVSLLKEIADITTVTSQNKKITEDKISGVAKSKPLLPVIARDEVPKQSQILSTDSTITKDKIASADFVSLAMTSEGARNNTPANPSDTDVISESSKASTAISVSHITGRIPSEEFIAKSQSGDKIPDNTKGGSGKGDTNSLYALIRAAIEKAKTYPFLAREKRLEGTVVTEFIINSNGYPENIAVAKSSGSEILDSAAMNIITRAAPFPQADGHIVIPITFSLTRSTKSPLSGFKE